MFKCSNYGYAGEWTDAAGLQYLRARYLDTGVGRFISRDNWAGDYNNPLSLNRWMYVEGNPVNYIDPSGMCSQYLPYDDFQACLNWQDQKSINDSLIFKEETAGTEVYDPAADSSDVACLLKTLDVDALFLARFKHYWAELISVSVTPQFPNQHPNYAAYINDYLAYSFYAILKRWIQSDMEFSPEIMGNLLFDLTGLHVLLGARKNFHENIKQYPAKKH